MMNIYHALLCVAVLLEVGSSLPTSLGVSCQDHPGYFEGLKPVLVKSWKTLYGTTSNPGMYIVGHDEHRYAPIDDPDSLKFDRLDWFWVTKSGPARQHYVKLSLTRPAKVYMLVGFKAKGTGPSPTLPGWTGEGIVRLTKGRGTPLQFGIYQASSKYVLQTMYMFSRTTHGDIVLPNMKWVTRAARGILITGNDWLVLISEEDGTAPILQYPVNPTGVNDSIVPNARCPDQLHDLWVTSNTDEADEDTRGMKWKTWHPQWDPCYWCAYDHEHGSSAKDLMGYEPKFHYTSWKNGREEESHEGYKGYVFRHDSYFIYFMVHMQTSNMRRVLVRHHTILFAVTNAETKELLMEITHKADFGFIFVKARSGRQIPLSRDERSMYDSQLAEGMVRKHRSINVIDISKPNPFYLYRTPRRDLRKGVYETWSTVPICSADNKLGMVTFDVISSASGIKKATTRGAEYLKLGYFKYRTFYRQTGSARLIRLTGFAAGEDYCCFKVANMQGRRYADGSFYTDAYGVLLKDGASAGSVKQFVKPGFNMKISGSGRYGAVESWTGLYENDVFGSIVNYGYSIDPNIN